MRPGTEIATIKDAVRHEGESVWQLFAPGMRVALVIGVVLAVLQQVTGINVFLYFAPEIFRRIAGANTDAAMLQTIVVGVVNMSFTIVAIWTVDSSGTQAADDLRLRRHGDQPAGAGAGRPLPKNGNVGPAIHARLHRILRLVGWSGDVGHSVGDFPHEDPRAGDGDRHGLPVDRQLRYFADLSR